MSNGCLLVTGGAGFIGSNFVLESLNRGFEVVNVDKLTYAGNLENLAAANNHKNYHFIQADIVDRERLDQVFEKHEITAVINFAAESHVDRSIDGPAAFVETNVVGTFQLLQATLGYWRSLSPAQQSTFRFLHVSTDEVYGSLGKEGAFKETTPYAPNSPYSASKAASDHLVRAYHHTYGLPVVTTNCSNNYGPYQFPEKLIPVVIMKALNGESIPVYGDGANIRDWLFVADHCDAILAVLEKGRLGETYNIGGESEKTNLEVVHTICALLDNRQKKSFSHRELVKFVTDRPGHDRRYAMDITKISNELGWLPRESFESGIAKTVDWYLSNQTWCNRILDGSYRLQRLGLG